MRFEFLLCEDIPRLAWCAHLQRGTGIARVYHGPWVETHDDWFVEGAWSGPFAKGDIDRALFNVGTGGVLRAGQPVFCTQTDATGRLHSLRTGGDQLFISNSLAFALTMAGDEPDPCYPFYGHKLQEYDSDWISRKKKTIHTLRSRNVRLHDHCQVVVRDDMRLLRIEKPAFSRPGNFAEYVSMLHGVLGAVLENAASSARQHRRYDCVAMISRGYDSTAAAALLARLGVREAMTFYDKVPGDDSAEEVARLLGMKVRAYGRLDFRTMQGLNEAEFLCSAGKTSDVVLAPCEAQFCGKAVVTGRFGDVVFDYNRSKKLRPTQLPRYGGGARLNEFRLRVGFLNFNPLYAGGLHSLALHRIASSQEMTPWRLGGDYDRPIARRIIEEAGVPRGLFGVDKSASAYYQYRSTADMSPANRADFESYRRSMPRPGLLRFAWHRGLVMFRSACEKAVQVIRSIWWSGGATAASLIPIPHRYQEFDDMDFAMHWGQARVRERYAEAKSLLDDPRTSRPSSPRDRTLRRASDEKL